MRWCKSAASEKRSTCLLISLKRKFFKAAILLQMPQTAIRSRRHKICQASDETSVKGSDHKLESEIYSSSFIFSSYANFPADRIMSDIPNSTDKSL